MQASINAGSFLEHAEVHGNLYGTSVAAVQKCADEGKSALLEIDVQVRFHGQAISDASVPSSWHSKQCDRPFHHASVALEAMRRKESPRSCERRTSHTLLAMAVRLVEAAV